ncbi:MAG: tetratricopeptide repeat protein [Phycisphaerales bacterium]|jgi:tetratricopeptide (TPR) repeat protein|nr:tetratricopeptide repeat protein [Phycisphaerales bacterium]
MSNWLDAETLAGRAEDLFESGRLGEAEAALRQAIAIDQTHPEWHHRLGLILQYAERLPEAMACFDQAAELEPGVADHVDAAATVCLIAGDFDTAAERMERLIRIDPTEPQNWVRLIDAYVDAGRHDEAETSFYLSEMQLSCSTAGCLAAIARSLFLRREWNRAAWCLEEAVRIDPQHLRAHHLLAEVLAASGRIDEATEAFERIVKGSPVDAGVALSWAELLARTNRIDEAGAVLRQIIGIEPTNAHAHFQMAQISMRQRRFQQAALTFQLVHRLDRDYPDCDRLLAECLLHLGQAGDAKRLLCRSVRRLREITPGRSSEGDLISIGELLLRAELPDEAAYVLNRYRQHHAIEPEDAGLLRMLARARYLSGDLEGGRAISRQILRIDPSCVASVSNLAIVALEQGRLKAAWGWVRKGRRLHPRDEAIRRVRLRILLRGAARVFRRFAGVD